MYDEPFSLQDKTFSGQRLGGDDALERPELVSVRFDGCDIAGWVATEGRADRVTISSTRMRGVTWAKALLRDCAFSDVTGESVSVRFSTLRNVTFTDVSIAEFDFTEARFENVTFMNCRLAGAIFDHAHVTSARFSGCDLSGATGVDALAGASVHPDDAMTMTFSMAASLGIKVSETG